MDTKRVPDAPLRATVFAKRHKTQPAVLDDWEIPVGPSSRLCCAFRLQAQWRPLFLCKKHRNVQEDDKQDEEVQEYDKQDEEVRKIVEASFVGQETMPPDV